MCDECCFQSEVDSDPSLVKFIMDENNQPTLIAPDGSKIKSYFESLENNFSRMNNEIEGVKDTILSLSNYVHTEILKINEELEKFGKCERLFSSFNDRLNTLFTKTRNSFMNQNQQLVDIKANSASFEAKLQMIQAELGNVYQKTEEKIVEKLAEISPTDPMELSSFFQKSALSKADELVENLSDIDVRRSLSNENSIIDTNNTISHIEEIDIEKERPTNSDDASSEIISSGRDKSQEHNGRVSHNIDIHLPAMSEVSIVEKSGNGEVVVCPHCIGGMELHDRVTEIERNYVSKQELEGLLKDLSNNGKKKKKKFEWFKPVLNTSIFFSNVYF